MSPRLLNRTKFSIDRIFSPMYIDFDEYPHYSGRNSGIFEKDVNENIQCDHGCAYSSGKQKMCTWIDEDSLEMTKNCFPDAKQIKNVHNLFYSKNVHMFKKI